MHCSSPSKNSLNKLFQDTLIFNMSTITKHIYRNEVYKLVDRLNAISDINRLSKYEH